MISGIYIIKNLKSGKVYIGQSVDVKRRLSHHKNNLRKGTHKNDYMQKSFNSDGEENFCFDLLEECEKSDLDDREKFWISHYQSDLRKNGYNIESGGHLGHTWNEDAKKRRSGKGNPMYGKKHSKQFVERIRTINRANSDKLTEDDVKNIKMSLYKNEKTMKELAEIYNVDFTTIAKIKKCNNWEWVLPELNDFLCNKTNIEISRIRNKIYDMHISGKDIKEIAKEIKYSRSRVSILINQMFPDEKEAKIKEKDEKIKQLQNDFIAGVSKDVIMKKYNVGHNFYVKYTKDIRADQKRKLIEKVQYMRNNGFMVKDIAEKLNLHRTTVTEYCKIVQGNTESV